MKTAMIILATISLFACTKQKKEQNTCHTCVYSRINDTTTICDDPSRPGYETNLSINHNLFVSSKCGYCIN